MIAQPSHLPLHPARPAGVPRGRLEGTPPCSGAHAPPAQPLPAGPVVQMMSQGASKTNIALIVNDTEAKTALRALHVEFFGSA